MSQLNRTQFTATYEDSATGTFLTNTTQAIGSGDLRQFADDINDSFLNIPDGVLTGAQVHPGSSTTVVSSFRSIFYTRTELVPLGLLLSNSSPLTIVAAPSTGYMIVPIMFHVAIDYNSAAYATNTSFRFEINGVAVSGSNSTILPSTADRFCTMSPIDIDTTTNLSGQALVFETQTGDPTAGNSTLYVGCVYKVVWRLGIEP